MWALTSYVGLLVGVVFLVRAVWLEMRLPRLRSGSGTGPASAAQPGSRLD